MASADLLEREQAIKKDVTSKCHQIYWKDLSMEEDVLGSGAYGTVHRGNYRGVEVAVKVVDQRKYSERHMQTILTCKEARSMCSIEHKSIVKIYGIILDDMCGLVLEFMKYGSLSDLLAHTEDDGSHLPISIQVEMIKDVSEAMRFLHSASPSLVHADLKLANILIDNHFKAKLGDFGVSTLQYYTTDLTDSTRAKGTLTHMAPELFKPDLVGRTMPKNTSETDVWSFGVLLFELMMGESPFKGLQTALIERNITRGIKDHCLSELKDSQPSIFTKLISGCLEYQPTERTDFERMACLLHDEYIEEYKQFYLDDLKTLTLTLQRTMRNEQTPHETVTNERRLYRRVVNCPAHVDNPLIIYCEQCEIPICVSCSTSSHNQHKFQDMKEAANNAGEVLREIQELWKDVPEHYEMLCEKRKQSLESLEQQQKACVSQIKRTFHEITPSTEVTPQEIKDRENIAIDQLNKEVEAARKRAEAAYDEVERKRGEFVSVVEDVNNLLTSALDAEKLLQFKGIMSRLKNLNSEGIETQLIKTLFKLQPEKIAISDLTVNIISELKLENISSKFLQKIVSNVAVSSKSPVHRVRLLSVVREPAQLERRFSSLLEGEREGECWGLAVGVGGLIVTDYKNTNVKVFDKNDFTFKFTLNQTQHQLQSPGDVTWSTLGEIFITDRGIHGVVKYDAAGRVLKVYRDVYEGPGYITCHNDQLIVADTEGGRVMFTDYECKVHHQIDARTLGLSKFKPRYVCVDENTGHLVVSEWWPGGVHVIDSTGQVVINTYTDKLGGRPRGMCVDHLGNTLVVDYYNHQVILFTAARAHVLTSRGDVWHPTDVCVSDPGQVSVLEENGEVKVFTYLDI